MLNLASINFNPFTSCLKLSELILHKSNFSVVIIEDNKPFREEILLYLNEEGFTVKGFDTGVQLDDFIELGGEIDILILDVKLPGESGISILRRMRKSRPGIGIILLSGRTGPVDRIHGYENGADFYLAKPVPAKELDFVIQSLCRRLDSQSVGHYWRLLPDKRTLEPPNSGKKIKLTFREGLIIEALCKSPGNNLSTLAISEQLDQNIVFDEIRKHNIEAIVSRLRLKIKTQHPDSNLDFIKSIWNYGYQLCAEVKCV